MFRRANASFCTGTRAAGDCFYAFSSPAAVAIEAAVKTAEGVALTIPVAVAVAVAAAAAVAIAIV